MTTSRDTMIKFLEKKGCKVVGTTEDFSGQEGGIWIAGDEEDGLFDYYACSSYYTFGVLNKLNEAVKKKGWWLSFNDPGTVMCWPIN